MKKLSNILITGTPGCGKTTLAQEIVSQRPFMTHIEGSRRVKEHHLHDGYDEEYDTYTLNEDKFCDDIEEEMNRGGVVLDFHSCDFMPERWFDLVIVLTTDNSVLYQRLEKRRYSEKKIAENIECEIMRVVLDEAMESYPQEIVHALRSDDTDCLEENTERIIQWIDAFTNKI